jgi:exopolysaccharide biosynthesis protein
MRFEASPGLKIQRPGSWRAVHSGIELRKVVLERSDPDQEIELILVRIDSRRVAPRVLRGGDFNVKGADIKTFAEKSRAVAAINANYFDENGRALGFLKTSSGGHLQISKSSLFTGIFGVKNNLPFIVHRDEFVPGSADEALQAGPLLISKEKAVNVTRGAGRQSRRALVGIDKDNQIILAVTSSLLGGLTWVELQEFFGSPKWQAQVVDLLNLDGGGSAQLYVKGTHTEEHVPGSTTVPVALGFFIGGKD